MEIKNAKMDWNLILKGYLEFLEEKYPGLPIRESMELLIEKLTQNKIRSRVIVSGKEVAAYAYIVESEELKDRNYASIGFLHPDMYNEKRVENLLNWIISESKNDKKIPMINEIFNAPESWEAIAEEHGFRKFARTRMTIDLHDLSFPISEIPSGMRISPFTDLTAAQYAELAYRAYSGTEDSILYTPTLEQSLAMSKSLFSEEYGSIIKEASYAVWSKDTLSGCIVFTNGEGPRAIESVPLLADIDLLPHLRGKGVGRVILTRALSEMSRIGYLRADLWVSENNPARNLYASLGFTDRHQPREVFFYIPPDQTSGDRAASTSGIM
ncbi:MAG: GNAT family N-acetyltransferase [Thermoplasmataceae archaeon]